MFHDLSDIFKYECLLDWVECLIFEPLKTLC